jgi:hypothetical protein
MTTLQNDSNGNVIQVVGFGTTQTIAIGDNSVQMTNAVASSTDVVRLVSTVDCNVAIGANPQTASQTTSAFLPAGVVEYVEINGGQTVAVIKKSGGSAGTLFVTEGK